MPASVVAKVDYKSVGVSNGGYGSTNFLADGGGVGGNVWSRWDEAVDWEVSEPLVLDALRGGDAKPEVDVPKLIEEVFWSFPTLLIVITMIIYVVTARRGSENMMSTCLSPLIACISSVNRWANASDSS